VFHRQGFLRPPLVLQALSDLMIGFSTWDILQQRFHFSADLLDLFAAGPRFLHP
jgi:hypothetical protein